MNAFEGLEYLRAALIAAGIPAERVTVGMEMARPNAHSNAPNAAVYNQTSMVRREKRRMRVAASVLDPAVPDALGAVRNSLASMTTTAIVEITERSSADMQNVLAKLVTHLIEVPLVSGDGTVIPLPCPEDGWAVTWNDHDAADQVSVTLAVAVPGVLWRDHPIIPIDIVVQYRLDGGSPDE